MGQDQESAKRIKAELDKDNRDVADLWSDALRQYKGIVGTDLKPTFANVNDMIAFGTKEMNSFHSFRHNQKKVDKLRGLFMANIGYIETGAQQLVAAATPAFPPAAAIGTALTYMLSACKQVSADYDVVNAFFEDMNAFLQRITILESRLPKYPAYRNCLMDVFTAILKMCGFATKYIELGRLKKWVINMIKGEDSDLGGARKTMDTSLSRLQSATEYAILGNTEENNRMTVELQQNQELQTEMIENQTKMLQEVLEHQESVKNDLKNIQKLLVMFDQQHRDEQPKKASKAATKNKPATSHRIRSFFEETINPSQEYHNIKERLIADTCQWLFEEEEWKWFTALELDKQEGVPVLVVQGEAGLGKSHLAVSIYDQLVKSAAPDTCVVNFFFREQGSMDLRTFCNAINWAVIEVAEQNAALCERLNVEIQREDIDLDIYEWKNIWANLLVPLFPHDSPGKLHIVWDGIDELVFREKNELLALLSELKTACNLNISLVCTTRPDTEIDKTFQGANMKYAHVTPTKQVADTQALIWNHLNNDDGLKQFSKYAKQTIVSKLIDRSDGRPPHNLLFCEHILRQANSIGREALVLKRMNDLPEDWLGLYKAMLDDVAHHTSEAAIPAMKLLFEWSAFSARVLTLDECLSLLRISGHGSFDLERELQGNSLSRFLRVALADERDAAGVIVEEPTLESLSITTSNDETTDGDGDHPLRFHDRSMREFFKADVSGQGSLRTSAGQAHGHILLLCRQILCGDHQDVHRGLKTYAAGQWAYHYSWWQFHSGANAGVEEADKIAGLEALAAIMNNAENACAMFEELDVDYDNQLWPFDDIFAVFAWGGKLGVGLAARLSPAAREWYQEISGDVQKAFVPLAKAHVANWFKAESPRSVLLSYRFARQCIKLTSYKHILVPNENGEDPSSDDEIFQYDEAEILGVFNAFEDVPKDGKAYRALCTLLEGHSHYVEARDAALKGIELLPDGLERYEVRLILANAYLGMDALAEASETIDTVLAWSEAPPPVRRRALVNLAKVQKAKGNWEDAAKSYEQARHADPQELMPGADLSEELRIYLEQRADTRMLELVATWTITEKLTLMTWDYDGTGHTEFFQAAGRAGKVDIAVQIYEEVIRILDTLDSAAPIRYQLAQARWLINGDIEGAKTLLNETLDSTSHGNYFKFTNEDPSYTLVVSILLMTDLIYEQYRSSSDPAIKAQLFTEIKGLTSRPLAQSIAPSRSDLHHHTVVVSKMARKMGSAVEFQTTLQSAFDACYEALIDNVGWNDWLNIMNLASIVMQLDGLERDAEILVSAQFSQLDPNAVDKDDDDAPSNTADASQAVAGAEQLDETINANDTDDEEVGDGEGEGHDDATSEANSDTTSLAPTDEGELGNGWVGCDGDCRPNVEWQYWKGRTMYVCLTCRATNLCEECHEKRQTYNEDMSKCPVLGPYFCGRDHEYIRGPIAGWQGVTNGVMSIEGEEDVDFKVWLEELRNDKWVKSWQRFWLEE